jgi:hypothetical protein
MLILVLYLGNHPHHNTLAKAFNAVSAGFQGHNGFGVVIAEVGYKGKQQ